MVRAFFIRPFGVQRGVDVDAVEEKLVGPALDVPEGFREAVRRAEREGWIGDLLLLADEAERFSWSLEGLRTVGESLLDLKCWRPARILWEKVRTRFPEDAQAYRRLATIYQATGDLTRSDESVNHLLRTPGLTRWARAEAWVLRGSNARTRWIANWRAAEASQREEEALRSPELETARTDYRTGYLTDQNHASAGINALGLIQVSVELAERHPDVWTLLYDSDEDAANALATLKLDRERIAQALHLSIAAEERALDEAALRPDVDADDVDEARRSLDLARADLRLFAEDRPGRAVLLDALQSHAVGEEGSEPAPAPRRVLVFCGHRLDTEGRAAPRFPATPGAIAKARSLIRAAVEHAVAEAEGARILGLSGGASGGDILFHEVCAEVGVPTHLYLLADRDNYVRASVADAGPEWIARFDRLHAELPVRVLQDGPTALELPDWLLPLRGEYSVWQRNNRWLLDTALAHGSEGVTVLGLWDGKKRGDGESVTAHMVALAKEHGCPVVHLDALELLDA